MRCCSAIALALLLTVTSAPAQPRPLGELFHQAWELREGAPGTITSIAQSADGYLWLTSPSGLYRFDGVRFERARLPGEPIRRPVAVWSFADGSVWVVHDRGALSSLHDGQRATYTGADGVPALRGLELARDRDGVMWASGDRGLARLADGRWEMVVPATTQFAPTAPTYGVFVDRSGAIWACVDGRVLVRRPGAADFEPFMPLAVTQFAQSSDGVVWAVPRPPAAVRAIATADGRPLDTGAGQGTAPGRRAVFDASGALWLATAEGVLRTPAAGRRGLDEHHEQLTAARGLTHDSALAAFADREGNVWIGTAGGLDLFRDTIVTNADPLPPMHATRLATHGGDVWAGDRARLFRVRGRDRVAIPVAPPISAVHAAPDGTVRVWGGVSLWRGSATAPFTAVAGTPDGDRDEAWGLAVDGAGRTWAQFLRGGAWILDGDRWVRPAIDGLDGPSIAALMDDGRGRIWMSDAGGERIARVDGPHHRIYGPADGLRVGQLSGLAVDGPRTWLAGRAGVAVVDDAGVHPIAGLDEDSIGIVRGIARRPEGTVWLNADHGIVRIGSDDAARAATDSAFTPRYRVFDHLDGMVGGSAPRPSQAALATPGGAVWFVGYDGVLAIDPTRIAAAEPPPPVRVTLIRTGARDFTAANGLELPVGSSNLRIAYTGLSLTMPDRVRFRYRLDGVDQGWQEAGDRREAIYTNLAPGTYTFRVIASNNNGVWPETGAETSFAVPPALHQTWAFRLGTLLALGGLAWGAFRLRVRQVAAALHGRLEARVAERERIARELHDTLLQSVQGLILRFQAIASRLPAGDPAAVAMEDALSRADDVLAEGRDRVRDLRRSTEASPDLVQALAAAGSELAGEPGLGFAVAVEGTPRPLHPIVRDEALWIAREAIANAAHHAHGRRIEAEVTYAPDALWLRCRDDGQGMAPSLVTAGRPEHFGLRGMHERARRIGARLHVWTRPGAGTEVELRVPAAMAFADEAMPRRPWLARVLAGGR